MRSRRREMCFFRTSPINLSLSKQSKKPWNIIYIFWCLYITMNKSRNRTRPEALMLVSLVDVFLWCRWNFWPMRSPSKYTSVRLFFFFPMEKNVPNQFRWGNCRRWIQMNSLRVIFGVKHEARQLEMFSRLECLCDCESWTCRGEEEAPHFYSLRYKYFAYVEETMSS